MAMREDFRYHDECLACSGPRPTVSALIRAEPEDFQVEEILEITPSGEGEHYLMQVRKRNVDTQEVAARLARVAGVPQRDVSYCGLKDRRAVCWQWFSVRMPGRSEPAWQDYEDSEVAVLECHRHRRKLRRGAHGGNRFSITLRDVSGAPADLEARLGEITRHGIPNYFGPQRFGADGGNVLRALDALTAKTRPRDRYRYGLYVSAARSWLFNRVLSNRVAAGNWNQALEGDVFMLDGTRSIFTEDRLDDNLRRRIAAMDLHPAGPLWGRGAVRVRADAAAIQDSALQGMETLCGALESARCELQHRALRARVAGLSWRWDSSSVELDFCLARGVYATSVLRECVALRSPSNK
ncbi:MAG: tRNA pseudouridine(13) synthase TruD [Gammaproteobacteria bacterium]|nr:tRNA pseudouridine(13) synthase TruD [Gammaproteobacteria bacterium]MDH3465041.1 tRNA pseudouridine(13) synthase TruD [Gammaproteobacteria bacterium]